MAATSTPSAAGDDPRTAGALALVERLAEDMVRRWRQGQRPLAEDYFAGHPELWQAPEAALELISEEISLRHEQGEEACEADLARRFPLWGRQIAALLDCHRLMEAGPSAAPFPAPGESVGDFALLEELGRGSHARVFLARQSTLADRLIVLKLGPRGGREHHCLARLQHTHIVPLYSVHDFPGRGLRGLCLPYFGGTTLEQLQQALAGQPSDRRGGNALLAALRERAPAGPGSAAVGGPICRFLARATHGEVVSWLGACLADALHYAHERGLVHLDLKPSNVLLAADGQPMLLDFHLARGPLAAGAGRPAWLGGTPGYMAPEQQAALHAVVEERPIPAAVDGRADIYALGRLLGELLVGVPLGAGEAALSAVRRCPEATPGLADLLGRCLAVDPAARYATAADLASDLRRHLGNLPLRGVRNRSPIERWRKWRRRRPYTWPLLLLGLLAAAAAGLVGAHFHRQLDRVDSVLREGKAHLEHKRYAEARAAFRHGAALADDLPFTAGRDRQMREYRQIAELAGAASELHRFSERLRPLYGVDQLPATQAQALVGHCRTIWAQREEIHRRLARQPDADLAQQVRDDLLDLAIVEAHLRVRLGGENAAGRKQALAVLAQAEELLGASCVLYRERRTHALALGQGEMAREAERRGSETPPRTAWEHYALGRAYMLAGDLPAALRELETAVERQPRSLWPTFHKGCCAYRLGRHDDAATAFSICLVLAPESAWCAYNRSLAHIELGRPSEALRDLDRALRLDSDFAAALLSRAALHHREKRFGQALEDLQRARRAGLDTAAVHCSLALVHLAREDRPAALACVREALRRAPEHPQARKLLLTLGQER